MSDQAAVKKILQDLVKREDLQNKTCIDCGNPNPQWASLSFAVFLCLQCAGLHRGYGVHISFVRSISMDTWSDDQIKRMQAGGNAPFKEFMSGYAPAQQGGYKDGMAPYDMYHCWAASQYKEKLSAGLEGKPWSPSAPPAGTPGTPGSDIGRPSSAQGLRKSRASTRAGTSSSLRRDSASPASFHSSPGTPNVADQKTANESYFASLGQTNALRPENLPPSQGGRYQGFGSTPSPPPSSMNSTNMPSLSDIQENPVAVLSKGWSLFSAAVAATAATVSDNVVQPGLEKIRDPTFQASVNSYVGGVTNKAGEIGRAANNWSKEAFGVDVAGQMGDVVGGVRGRMGGGPYAGYTGLNTEHDGESSSLWHDPAEDDDFQSWSGYDQPRSEPPSSSTTAPKMGDAKPKDGWDDDWKDF